jgi:hypothetical protein
MKKLCQETKSAFSAKKQPQKELYEIIPAS